MTRHVANRDLGQHFLVDENILRVIGRLAGLAPEDVVLEIGPGLGALTVYGFSTENWTRPEAEVAYLMGLPGEVVAKRMS